jgi:hypothetical protein
MSRPHPRKNNGVGPADSGELRASLVARQGVGRARSLSDSGLIYCAGGRAAHSSPIFRYIAPLCASKSANSVLALPPCSLRSPQSDRLLGNCELGRRGLIVVQRLPITVQSPPSSDLAFTQLPLFYSDLEVIHALACVLPLMKLLTALVAMDLPRKPPAVGEHWHGYSPHSHTLPWLFWPRPMWGQFFHGVINA